MRRPHRSLDRIPGARALGGRIREALRTLLSEWAPRARASGERRPGGKRTRRPKRPRESPCALLLAGKETGGHDPDLVREARHAVAGILELDPSTAPEEGIWAGLIEAHGRCSGDPDQDLASWIRDGAPSGVLDPVLQSSIFPTAD